MMETKDPTDKNIYEVLETLVENYGYDFRQYSQSHIRRRVSRWMSQHNIQNTEEINRLIKNDEEKAYSLIYGFSISVTTMFRDPFFYNAVREKVIPFLRTYPFIKVWHAGCATGEEVYSMAILLMEEDLYHKCRIYATDFNEEVLQRAREGIYSNEQVEEFEVNYKAAGGQSTLSNYYSGMYGSVIMDQQLKKNIVWANHNLVTDYVFSEVNLVVCRNVLIYFTQTLQERALAVFNESLPMNGILCLGSRETLQFTSLAREYRTLDKSSTIFQKRPSLPQD